MSAGRLIHIREAWQAFEKAGEEHDLYRVFSRGLIVAIALLAVLAVREAVSKRYYFEYKPSSLIQEKERLGRMAAALESKPFSLHSQGFEKRNIFVLAPAQKKPITAQNMEYIKQFIENFKLVGIVIDRHPQAIVEDKKTGKVFFMKTGEEAGGAVLKKIEESSATFLYEGEIFKLSQ